KPFAQEFGGPPTGPWTAFGPMVRFDAPAYPVVEQADGVNLFTIESAGEGYRYSVREGDAAPVRLAILPAAVATRFAGDAVAFIDGEHVMLALPGAAPRPVGVPSATLGDVVGDAAHLLWTANGCLLSTDVAAPPAQAPDAGACARSELAVTAAKARVGR